VAEWYYAKNALDSLSYFRKEIATFIQSVSDRAALSSLACRIRCC